MTISAGALAPVVSFRGEAGEIVSLDQLRENGRVVLGFFKTTCPTCMLALPFLNRLAGGAQVYTVSQDDAAKTREFYKEHGVEVPALFDLSGGGYSASNAFGITHVPSIFLVEPDGRVSWSSVGFVKAELEDLGRMLDRQVFTGSDVVPSFKGG